MPGPRILLASASPRRRELLAGAGLEFDARATDVPEDLPPGIEPEAAAVLLAERKARAAREASAEFVLAADTIVAVGTEFLGKPSDRAEARRMLERLSGSRHKVITGVCALRTADGKTASAFERTFVTMRAITPVEIEAYVASGEWEGKAGGYAIQETADRFVTRLEEGGFDNVVGLPVGLALDLLERLGAPRLAPPHGCG
jgi:nucleoside triphosphate pyrophosphatase